MNRPQHIAVIDIGKTNAKLALVDLDTLTEVAVVTRPNVVLSGPPWPHYDVDGHWSFLLDALATFHSDHRVDAISITTHGACAALLAADGSLAAPILDYEHEYPAEIVAAYDAIKPDFALTGSPKMVGGLNIGAQLHYSDLPATLGIADKIAPVRHPSDILGPILPHIAAATGLDAKTPVCVGIHDSNASLYPHVISRNKPASVVSTGTWVIAMSLMGNDASTIPPLDPNRDTLINVNARGQAVPSARFMGGREYEIIQSGHPNAPTEQDIASVLGQSLMLLPSVESGTGPFQGRTMQWHGLEPPVGSGERAVALSFYLALMTGACLELIEGEGPTIVEGPFARNAEFVAMLKAITNRPVSTSEAATGTSIGAALLFNTDQTLPIPTGATKSYVGGEFSAYVDPWKTAVQSQK